MPLVAAHPSSHRSAEMSRESVESRPGVTLWPGGGDDPLEPSVWSTQHVMCGIAGILSLEGEVVARPLLQQMISRIRHRGPDGTGEWVDGSIGLAHSRLSIIDLAGGHQPMSNVDGSLWITFNGEIFN